MYKIVFKRKSCIGAGECAVISPDFWKMEPDNKATLKNATLNPKTGCYELTISDSDYAKQKMAAASCPTSCITIEKI